MTVSKSNNDYVPNITKYALKGYDLIIAVGYLEEQAVGQVAKKFPDVKFAIIDDSVDGQGPQGSQERPGHPLQGVGGRLPRRLPRRAVREVEREGPELAAGHLVRRRHRDPAGRPLHRRLPVRREGGQPRHQAAQRLLRRLRRAGQVPGPRPAADRAGLGHHLPGRGPVRPRRHQRGARQGLLGDRRRRQPGARRSAPSSCSPRPRRASTSPSSTSSARS